MELTPVSLRGREVRCDMHTRRTVCSRLHAIYSCILDASSEVGDSRALALEVFICSPLPS